VEPRAKGKAKAASKGASHQRGAGAYASRDGSGSPVSKKRKGAELSTPPATVSQHQRHRTVSDTNS
jgi:hypothetical protein